MNEQGVFAATLLDASSKAFAAGVVLRLQESGPAGDQFVKSWGFQELVADTQVRLQHLAEALAVGRPELFAADVEWLAATYAAREAPVAVLRTALSCLSDEIEENLPANMAKLVGPYVRAGLAVLDAPISAPCDALVEGNPHLDLARKFLVSALETKRSQAEQLVLSALDSGVSFTDLHQYVITPTQHEIGRMWQTGEITVAEEHLSSRIVEGLLAVLRSRTPKAGDTGLSVLFACVSGDLHDIGLRIVADQFEIAGWRTIYLGANMPAKDLARAASDFKPDLIALSVGLTIHMRAAAAAIAELRSVNPGTPILVGGRPFTLLEDLWKDLGADGCTKGAALAVSLGEKLARKKP